MDESRSTIHWYIAVPKAGRSNLERGLRAETWGAKERGKFIDPQLGEIREGDLVHFVHEIQWDGEGASPQGFPRVLLDQYIAKADETIVQVTGPIFEDSSRIWDDDLYPVRFPFSVQNSVERVRLAPDSADDSVRDAVRLSGISQGKAIAVRTAATGVFLQKALATVLGQYLAARREPFPNHPVFHLVNRDLPSVLSQSLGLNAERYRIQASAGQGNWAMVPWVAILDRIDGGTIQNGLCLAVLFRADMTQVVFALMFGVTGSGEESVLNTRTSLAERVESLQSKLDIDQSDWQVDHHLKLADQGVGARYGQGVVAYRAHFADRLPSNLELATELKELLHLYDQALDVLSLPIKTYPEVPENPEPFKSAKESSVPYRAVPFRLENVHARIEAMGYQITADDLLNVLLAVQVRPFVIFSGRSGTGKTTLSRILATIFDWHYEPVAVSPAWADPADLLGFISPVNQQRVDGALSSLLSGRHGQTLLCLDEFNVAKVEHYFSDFISAMDAGVEEGFWGDLPSLGRLYPNESGRLRLPSRFVVVATMNFDDSVQSITPRVLDRANVIEFDIGSMNDLRVGKALTWTALEPALPFEWPWIHFEESRDLISEESIRLLWQALRGSRGQFGHRVAQEVGRYVAYGLSFASELDRTEEEQRLALLDRQMVQRLLPKFHGTAASRDIAGLMRLLAVLVEKEVTSADDVDRQGTIDEAANRGQFPQTVAKVQQLVSSYTEDGYASFW